VILHRVICCYPDGDTLTAAACSRARDRVAVTIPREAPRVRLAFWAARPVARVDPPGLRVCQSGRSDLLSAVTATRFVP